MALVEIFVRWSVVVRQGLLGRAYGVSMAGFSIDALIKAPAVRLDSLMLVRLLLYVHAAARSGRIWHRISRGRWWWNDATAVWTPFSAFILAARTWAADLVSGSRHWTMARLKFSTVRERYGIGGGPALAEATMLPQKGWLSMFSKENCFLREKQIHTLQRTAQSM